MTNNEKNNDSFYLEYFSIGSWSMFTIQKEGKGKGREGGRQGKAEYKYWIMENA